MNEIDTFINMKPHTFEFNLHNMSREKVEFNLPVVFTIGPVSPVDAETERSFKKFAQNMSHLGIEESQSIIRGVVEGETRGLTANLTIEEMFNSKEKFREEVVSKIGLDLREMGLHIYNANIKEMSDYDENNKYFTYRKQRAIESASCDAQVEVSEARKMGEIGMKQRDKETRVTVAKLDTEATLAENERRAEIANSEASLQEIRAQANKRAEVANIEANLTARSREAELQSLVEVKRQAQILEQLRADTLAKTKVQAEQVVAEAEGQAAAIRHIADAKFYDEQKKSEAVQLQLAAHAAGLATLVTAAQGDSSTVKFYLALKEGIYEKLAEQQAKAVAGMQPKISVWNTGSNAGDSDPLAPILKTVQSIAPMLDGLHKHSDFKVPDWLIKQEDANKKQ